MASRWVASIACAAAMRCSRQQLSCQVEWTLTVRHEAVLVLPQEIRRCTELCQSAAVALF